MITLADLKDISRERKHRKRVGRGTGSGVGKTCGRGTKGAGARSGFKHRWGHEGGQVPLYQKLPTRGFSNARFRKEWNAINLRQIDFMFEDGETVNYASLQEKGYLSGGKLKPLKILGDGELTKKVTVEANAISAGAKEKMEKAGIAFTLVS